MEKNKEPDLIICITKFETEIPLYPSIIQEKGTLYLTTLIIPKQESASNSVSIQFYNILAHIFKRA